MEGMTGSFHFDMGNSAEGPIGLCARINAKTAEEAVERLREAFEEIAGDLGEIELHTSWENREKGEYICIYLNSDNIEKNQIDEMEYTKDEG